MSVGHGVVAVVGVSSQLGRAVIAALGKSGFNVLGFSTSPATTANCELRTYKRGDDFAELRLSKIDALISLTPLPVIGEALKLAQATGCRRVIAFGSTGVFTKGNSISAIDRAFVRDQLAAESRLAEVAAGLGINWTLFRPTMIYGAGTDQNVTFIRSVIRKLRCFPIPQGASGLRQPVHVDDLAIACVQALENPLTFCRAFNLGGGSTLEYREMVRAICIADGLPVRLLTIPATLYRWLVTIASRLPGLDFIQISMVDRMFVDLTTDHSDAAVAFGYTPRPFSPPGRNTNNSAL